jgi:hypothetical protein
LNWFRTAKTALRNEIAHLKLPPAARAEKRKDSQGLPADDPGVERSIQSAIAWLLNAQRFSASRDGGVARHYSLIKGWAVSYPETTGYIVPTLVDFGKRNSNEEMLQAARKMADWLVAIQFDEGGFQGGLIDAEPRVPVTFNTGQILLGLACAAREWGEPYMTAMNRAAMWLVDTQDSDGCWRKHPTPFAEPGEKTYETHVAWGLFEAARVAPGNTYADAALANVRWAITHQADNGWMDKCCLSDPRQPLTHTLGYVLRGLLEANRYNSEPEILDAAYRLGSGLLSAMRPDGHLPGCLDRNWNAAVDWACITGSIQVAHCFLMLFMTVDETEFKDAAFALNRFARRSMQFVADPGISGGIKGSFPVDGGYGTYEFLNWAAKFFVDSNLLEADLRSASDGA